ncbi:HNH endonuclease family protein [Leifsonia xyli]|uniref:HNH endonuclease family protein n=1 Tax=Leifsonia xyli TaxID=1575 RepID=UPI003D67C1B1
MTHPAPPLPADGARNRRPTRLAVLAALATAVALLSGCAAGAAATRGGAASTPESTDASEPSDATSAAPNAAAPPLPDDGSTGKTALAVLGTLPVKGKAPATGYQRTADFGAAWLDVDRNGCDTRDDILSRDLTDVVRQGRCRVLSGTLDDAYTGELIHFVRGEKTSALVQIDHIVPLQNAWITGAQKLTQAQRVRLANDPLNLIAVDGRSNQQKSAGDAATWLPANRGSGASTWRARSRSRQPTGCG